MYDILNGVRVLDFGRYIAGPLCAAQLADYGADVIRIERPRGGDDRYVYPVTENGEGALFLQMNRNKRGVTLDPKAPGGQALFEKLVQSADIVISSFPPSAQKGMNLDYQSLSALKPDIIVTSVSAFGPEGPYAERVGFDGVAQAMSGSVWMSGTPGAPMKSFASWVDIMTGIMATQATLAAHIERMQSGTGREVQASLFASALTTMNFPLIEQALTARDRQATGNRAQSGGPADMFKTKDGWIMVQVIGNPLFRRWARLVGKESWIEDPRFASDELRSDHGDLLSERTAQWVSQYTTAEALAALAEVRIPAGPVLSPQAALDDPHVQTAGIYSKMAFPGVDKDIPIALTAARATAEPPPLKRRPPLLAEHNDEVFGALGYSAETLAKLRADSAI